MLKISWKLVFFQFIYLALCSHDRMTHAYSRQQLIDALSAEYEFLCHDDFDPDVDMSPTDYRKKIAALSYDELVVETSTDDIYTLSDFMSNYS